MINIQFGTLDQARGFLASVERIWEDMGADAVRDPKSSIAEHVEYRQL